MTQTRGRALIINNRFGTITKNGVEQPQRNGSPADGEPTADEKPGCDEQLIAKLAAELEAASPEQAHRQAWPGIEAACGEATPNALGVFLRPHDPDKEARFGPGDAEAFIAYQERTCPGSDDVLMGDKGLSLEDRAKRLFRGCDLARYGVIEEADAPLGHIETLLAFTVHQWMLDEGLDADTIRPITRALIPLDEKDEAGAKDHSDRESNGLGDLGLVGIRRDTEDHAGLGSSPGGDGGPATKIEQAKATVDGSLDSDIIRRIVRSHINEARTCYAKGLATTPDLSGRVTIQFTIDSRGKVSKSEVESSTLENDEVVGPCFAKAVKRWRFPRPSDGAHVVVSYPFDLSPG
ncbi:MAG: AgmX/PglI C-terminal domain-containing protein, partial [Myxococcota bacterium]